MNAGRGQVGKALKKLDKTTARCGSWAESIERTDSRMNYLIARSFRLNSYVILATILHAVTQSIYLSETITTTLTTAYQKADRRKKGALIDTIPNLARIWFEKLGIGMYLASLEWINSHNFTLLAEV